MMERHYMGARSHLLPFCPHSPLLPPKLESSTLGSQGYCCSPSAFLSTTWDYSVPAKQSLQAHHLQAWADQTPSLLSTDSSRARKLSSSPSRECYPNELSKSARTSKCFLIGRLMLAHCMQVLPFLQEGKGSIAAGFGQQLHRC